MSNKRFILWDRKDGSPHRDDDGNNIVSSGILGRVTADNVYLTAYASYPVDEPRRPTDLAVGEVIRGVRYTLSGGNGWYDIYRVGDAETEWERVVRAARAGFALTDTEAARLADGLNEMTPEEQEPFADLLDAPRLPDLFEVDEGAK